MYFDRYLILVMSSVFLTLMLKKERKLNRVFPIKPAPSFFTQHSTNKGIKKENWKTRFLYTWMGIYFLPSFHSPLAFFNQLVSRWTLCWQQKLCRKNRTSGKLREEFDKILDMKLDEIMELKKKGMKTFMRYWRRWNHGIVKDNGNKDMHEINERYWRNRINRHIGFQTTHYGILWEKA